MLETATAYHTGGAVVVTDAVPAVRVRCVSRLQLQSDHWAVAGTLLHCLVRATVIVQQLHEHNPGQTWNNTKLSPTARTDQLHEYNPGQTWKNTKLSPTARTDQLHEYNLGTDIEEHKAVSQCHDLAAS